MCLTIVVHFNYMELFISINFRFEKRFPWVWFQTPYQYIYMGFEAHAVPTEFVICVFK